MGNRFANPEKHCESGEGHQLMWALSECQGYRGEMEDGHTCKLIRATSSNSEEGGGGGAKIEHAFFAVFDGHSGDGASEIAGDHLWKVILKHHKTDYEDSDPSIQHQHQHQQQQQQQQNTEIIPGAYTLDKCSPSDDTIVRGFLDFDDQLRMIEREYFSAGAAANGDQDTRVGTDGGVGFVNTNKTSAAAADNEPQAGEAEQQHQQPESTENAATPAPSSPRHSNKLTIVSIEDLNNDEKMRELAQRLGGCTAVTVLLRRDEEHKCYEVICANIGDSRAILDNGGEVIALSRDHKPNLPEEKARIEAAGGYVAYERVDGNLALSRAFGDFMYKTSTSWSNNSPMADDMNGDQLVAENEVSALPPADPTKFKVIAIPEITRHTVRDEDLFPRVSFMVVACDGVWDVYKNEQLAERVRQLMDSVKLFDPEFAIPEDVLRPVRPSWVDKLVEEWQGEDLDTWIENMRLRAKGDSLLREWFNRAHTSGEFSEALFDNLLTDVIRNNQRLLDNFNEVKKALFDRIKKQHQAVEAMKQPITDPTKKLEFISRRLVDETIFELKSQDNVTLSIVVFRTEKQVTSPKDVQYL